MQTTAKGNLVEESLQARGHVSQSTTWRREARNRSLWYCCEALVLNFERARLINLGKERLAEKVRAHIANAGDGTG